MSLVHTVQVPRRPVSQLGPIIGPRRFEQLTQAAERIQAILAGRTIWNINSTAAGMWKGRPVIGSAVGGIIDQITEGAGILLPDPADLAAFGSAARFLLGDGDLAARMGKAAHAHVREQYLGDVHLLRYGRLLATLIGEG